MMNHSLELAAIAITAAFLAAAAPTALASGQLPILKECLEMAEKAPDAASARNQCMWRHWELMAEYD